MSKPIQPDIPDGSERYFTNCRGVNFNIPLESQWKKHGYLPKIRPETWTLLSTLGLAQYVPLTQYAPSDCFVGTNKTAQWWHYNPEDAENGISIIALNGLNAVRVFLDYYVWVYKDDHLSDIKNFLSICDKYKVRVQFVLWDQLNVMGYGGDAGTGEPTTESELSGVIPYGLAGPSGAAGVGSYWINSPLLFETSSPAAATNFFETKAKPYIDALASSVSSYQSMWSFDVQNETDDALMPYFRILTSGTSLYVMDKYPFIKTTFGNGAGFDPGQFHLHQTDPALGGVSPFYQFSSTVDFASLHTYGNAIYYLKKYVRDGVSGSYDTRLPAMYNEASNYPSINYPREVIRALHRDKNFGGLIYQGFSDRNGSRNPFIASQGILYGDGECRRSLDLSAYQDLASEQWDYSRRQLRKIIQKSPSTEDLDFNGYTSGVFKNVIEGASGIGVLPEHVSYQPSYSGYTESNWTLVRDMFYNSFGGGLTQAFSQFINPGLLNLNAYRYYDIMGSIYSPSLTKNQGKFPPQPVWNLAADNFTMKDCYDAFFTLSSLPSLASYSVDPTSDKYDARNAQVRYMGKVLILLTRTLFAASGIFPRPDVLQESLYGTVYDDLSGVHEVVSVEDRLAFSAAVNGQLRNHPYVDGRVITGLTTYDASAFLCHDNNNSCYYTTDPPPANPQMDDIDWEEYDTYYADVIDTLAVCMYKLQKYATDVNPDFSIF